MKFNELTTFLSLTEEVKSRFSKLDIKGIAYNSRDVQKDYVFVAIKGFKSDGHNYIDDAVKKGASAVFINKDRESDFAQYKNLLIPVDDTRISLALLSKAFFSNPAKKMKVIGVTGTNGKTSITFMVKEILNSANKNCGVIGTIACFIREKKIKLGNTTPESYELFNLMDQMVSNGCELCIMEVSSHALYLNRVYGIDFDAVIFTNLSEDHLDFHADMKDYLNAKLKILDVLKSSDKKNKCAFINADSNEGLEFIKDAGLKKIDFKTYGIKNESDYRAFNVVTTREETSFSLALKNKNFDFKLKLLGHFNVLNALSVIGVMVFLDYATNNIQTGLKNVFVPGRFQSIKTTLPFTVIVDYAHTDDALQNVLETIRNLKPKRIICLFGCGGDRETGKRFLMGEISSKMADITIITSDNPRTEDPELILDMIEQGVKRFNGQYVRITNRENAIKHSIEIACENDIILIAGKGHEDYQILKDKTIHFDDTEVASKYLREREKTFNVN